MPAFHSQNSVFMYLQFQPACLCVRLTIALIYFTYSSKYFSLERFSSASVTMSNFYKILKASFAAFLMASSVRLFQQSLRTASVCHFWQFRFAHSRNYLYLPFLAISLPLPAIISICLFRKCLSALSGHLNLPIPASSICLFRQLLFASPGSVYLPLPAASIYLFW